MAERGAQAALRGYRLQALYTLDRMLDTSDDRVFWLEGFEDLAILTTQEELLEVIQIKARNEPLTLKHLKPKKGDSFFRRVLRRRLPVPEKLVSFGPFGSTMSEAWQHAGKEREQTIDQFQKWGYTAEDAGYFMDRVALCLANETEVEERVYARLRETPAGGNPRSAFALLHYWLYLAAENKERITRRVLLDRLAAVGRYLRERAAHHQEWYTSVIPLEPDTVGATRDRLAEEFYQGIHARYEHIVAGVDVGRPILLSRIDDAFKTARIVVVRGASGQGKSALAYRYLHDYVPAEWRFEVKRIKHRQHAANIALALRNTLEAIGAPAVVYVDVEPRTTGWLDLVEELSRLSLVRMLITVREEDWRRASLSRAIARWEEVEVALDVNEAREIYEQLDQTRLPEHVLGFAEAWQRFGGNGPLLEFTYLVTQDSALEDRLAKQLNGFRDDVRLGTRLPNEVELLRCVSIAAACGARLNLLDLARDLELSEPSRTVDLFEREHLLRTGENGRVLTGLHAIRSDLVARLLTKDEAVEPWIASAVRALKAMEEEDLDVFLLHVFSDRPDDRVALIDGLTEMHPNTWTGSAGIVRALLWLGVSQYVTDNEPLIRELHERCGSGWWTILMPDIGNVEAFAPGLMKPLFAQLESIAEEARDSMTSYRRRLTGPESARSLARDWLSAYPWPASEPRDALDWANAAQVIFWVHHLGLGEEFGTPCSLETIERALDTVPVATAADLVFALSLSRDSAIHDLLERTQPKRLERFRRDTQTPVIDDNGHRIYAHFLVDPSLLAGKGDTVDTKDPDEEHGEERGSSEHVFNEEAVFRANLLHRLVPQRQQYATQGYGHQFAVELVEGFDEPHTDISVDLLFPAWPQELNIRFRHLGLYLFRPDDWRSHAQQVLIARQANVAVLEQLADALDRYRRRSTRAKSADFRFFGKEGALSEERWDTARRALERLAMLPRTAVDRWGMTSEGMLKKLPRSKGVEARIMGALSLARHEPYRKAMNDVFTPLKGYYYRANGLLIALPFLAQATEPEQHKLLLQLMQQSGVQENDGHVLAFNLAGSAKAFPSFQKAFRERFAGFFAADELKALDEREALLLRRVLVLWHDAILSPRRSGASGSTGKHPEKRLEQLLSQIRQKLRKSLRSLSREGIRACIHTEDVRWNEQSALWLTCDIDNQAQSLMAATRVYEVLKAALPRLSRGANVTLPYLAVELAWSTIHVVPLVRGRSVKQDSRHWYVSSVMSSSETSQPFLGGQMPLPLPDETWSALHLQTWSDARIELSEQLYNTVSRALLLRGCLADVERIPEGDAVAKEIIDEYKRDLLQQTSDALRRAGDLVAEMENRLDAVADPTKDCRPQLLELRNLLLQARAAMEKGDDKSLSSPTDLFSEMVTLTHELMQRWLTNTLDELTA